MAGATSMTLFRLGLPRHQRDPYYSFYFLWSKNMVHEAVCLLSLSPTDPARVVSMFDIAPGLIRISPMTPIQCQ
jgi:hypothetical protein